MSHLFVIADLETTGFSSDAEILEVAAVLADGLGRIHAEFSTLVQVQHTIPREITVLTGISQSMVNRDGIALTEALPRFLAFCADYPIFFHNAPFDKRFLSSAVLKLGLNFSNPVYCSLKVARAAWPQLSSHTLQALARHIGILPPTHRGLEDVRAALSVLLAAKDVPLTDLAA